MSLRFEPKLGGEHEPLVLFGEAGLHRLDGTGETLANLGCELPVDGSGGLEELEEPVEDAVTHAGLASRRRRSNRRRSHQE